MLVILYVVVMVFLAVLLVLLLVYAVYQSKPKRIGYIPLPIRAIEGVIVTLAIPEKSTATLADLGCGDGRVLYAALRSYPKLRGLGAEINPLVALLARWRLRNMYGRTQIIRRDLLATDLRKITYVFTYLNDPTMALLEAKFDQELPKGARLVSCDFPLPHRQPAKKIKIGETWQLGQTLYVYEY